jgi:hypothetical protein
MTTQLEQILECRFTEKERKTFISKRGWKGVEMPTGCWYADPNAIAIPFRPYPAASLGQHDGRNEQILSRPLCSRHRSWGLPCFTYTQHEAPGPNRPRKIQLSENLGHAAEALVPVGLRRLWARSRDDARAPIVWPDCAVVGCWLRCLLACCAGAWVWMQAMLVAYGQAATWRRLG